MLRSRRWASATRIGSACTRVRFLPSYQGFLGYVNQNQGACRVVWGLQWGGRQLRRHATPEARDPLNEHVPASAREACMYSTLVTLSLCLH